MSPLQTLLLLCCADPYTLITPTSGHADVTHHTRGHTLWHTSSYTVYLVNPTLYDHLITGPALQWIFALVRVKTHQQSHGGHAVTLAPYKASYLNILPSYSIATSRRIVLLLTGLFHQAHAFPGHAEIRRTQYYHKQFSQFWMSE